MSTSAKRPPAAGRCAATTPTPPRHSGCSDGRPKSASTRASGAPWNGFWVGRVSSPSANGSRSHPHVEHTRHRSGDEGAEGQGVCDPLDDTNSQRRQTGTASEQADEPTERCEPALPQCEEPLVERVGEKVEGGHGRQGDKHGQARVELSAGEEPEPPLAEHPGAGDHQHTNEADGPERLRHKAIEGPPAFGGKHAARTGQKRAYGGAQDVLGDTREDQCRTEHAHLRVAAIQDPREDRTAVHQYLREGHTSQHWRGKPEGMPGGEGLSFPFRRRYRSRPDGKYADEWGEHDGDNRSEDTPSHDEQHGGDEHPAGRLDHDLGAEPKRLPVAVEDTAPEVFRRVEDHGDDECDGKPWVFEYFIGEQRARQHGTEYERHHQSDLPMPDRGDDLTPTFSLRLPLGDVAPQRLGSTDP